MESNTFIIKARGLLKDFSELSVKTLAKGMVYKKSLSGDYEMWRLARFIFSDILSFKVSDQPFEKVNWFIPFVYKNKYSCVISHEKFGFRIYVYNGKTEDESKTISENLEAILLKVILIIVPLIEKYAKDALSKGEVILENRFTELFRPYDYFRKTALIKKRASQKQKMLISSKKTRKISLWRAYSSIHYYEQAAYFCFFSLLEHICVLFLAYRKIPDRNDVAKFSNLKWNEKFKKVFDISLPEFKKFYDSFYGLARYKRNPAAHGYAHTSFSFYLEGAQHKISCMLNNKNVAVQWQDQVDNFIIMESFLNLLNVHSTTKNVFMYLTAGMNVSFGKKELAKNDVIAGLSDKKIKEYVDSMVRSSDDAANMDW